VLFLDSPDLPHDLDTVVVEFEQVMVDVSVQRSQKRLRMLQVAAVPIFPEEDSGFWQQ